MHLKRPGVSPGGIFFESFLLRRRPLGFAMMIVLELGLISEPVMIESVNGTKTTVFAFISFPAKNLIRTEQAIIKIVGNQERRSMSSATAEHFSFPDIQVAALTHSKNHIFCTSPVDDSDSSP
jgi:hypothetical protein